MHSQRRRIVIAALACLALLDVARSFNARLAYGTPTEVWQPAPSVYADLAWPPGAGMPADAPVGERVYAQRCAVCHGPDGRGNGPAAPSLIPRPRDFTLALFKYKSTPGNEAPTDADLRRVVTRGLAASAMPSFGVLLTEAEIAGVVEQVKRLARLHSVPASGIVPQRMPRVRPNIARGRD